MSVAARTLIVLGASGDLTERLLLPGLGTLLASHRSREVQLIGTARTEQTDRKWRGLVRRCLTSGLSDDDSAAEQVVATIEGTRYLTGDPTDAEHLQALLAAADHPPVLYFALPPAVVAKICRQLREVGLPAGATLAFEKPFGTDEKSARELNELVRTLVDEEKIQRTDHFLSKPAVRGILGLRAASRLFEASWDCSGIESVEIVYDEDLALEGRAGYYDSSGALVDMLQSHLLQTLAVLATDLPDQWTADALRDNVIEVLRAVVLDADPEHATVRARYTEGTIDGKSVPAYLDEDGVEPSNETETFAQLRLRIESERWAGVPFTIRSGKAIGDPRQEIVIRFRTDPSHELVAARTAAQQLRIDLSTGELTVSTSRTIGEDPREVVPQSMTMAAPDLLLDAYGSLLAGALDDDQLLAVRDDAATECWRIVDPVLDAWRRGVVPMKEYPAGSDPLEA